MSTILGEAQRGGLRQLVEGYRPRDPHYIVMPDEYAAFPPRYRAIVAEELCHTVLEHRLWQSATLPAGAQGQDLTPDQHKLIEHDAQYLAGAILMPREIFLRRFEWHRGRFEHAGATREKVVRATVDEVSSEFIASEMATARRARDLKLMSAEEFKSFYLDKLRF